MQQIKMATYNSIEPLLGQSEEKFCLLMDGVNDYAIIMLNTQGFIVSWNRGAQRIKGYNKDEVVGQHFSLFYSDADLKNDKPRLALQAAAQTGRFEDEGWRIRNDGSRFFAHVVISALRDPRGTLKGFAKITRDITERRKSEQKLIEMEDRLRLAVDAGEVGIWDWDMITGSIWLSQKHNQIFGLQELQAKCSLETFLTFVVADDVAAVTRDFRTGLAARKICTECRIRRLDQSIRWLSIKGEIFKDEHGLPIRLVGTVVDITDRKEQEERQRLLAIIAERENFMATLTHDMKNPLIGAGRILDLLADEEIGELTDQQHQVVEAMRVGNRRVLNLIHNLVDVCRLESDVSGLFISSENLAALIQTASSVANSLSYGCEKRIKVIVPDEVQLIPIDRNKIERVLQNLIDNAMKFTPEGGGIEVRLSYQDGHATIEVENEGPGISTDDAKLLFKKYSQTNRGKKYSAGTGLGLYLCKQIIDAHGGTIECCSSEGISTIFRIHLPTVENASVTTRLSRF
jgi:PAS domain S-box-containing protein